MRQLLGDSGQLRVRPRCRALIAVPVALGALAGCGSGSAGENEPAGAAAVTQGPDASSPECTDLISRLPGTVLSRNRVTGAEHPANVAAWGAEDDPILLNCGVTPTGPTTDECIEVNDVSWVFRENAEGYTFLTYGRDPAVTVTVPVSVDRTQAPSALVELNDAVAPLEQTERRCYDLADTVPSASPS